MPYQWTYRKANGDYFVDLGDRAAARESPAIRERSTAIGAAVAGKSAVFPARDAVRFAEGKICAAPTGSNMCLHIEWETDARGTGIRAYREGDPRADSTPICTTPTLGLNNRYTCQESFSLPGGVVYILELVTVGIDGTSTVLRLDTFMVGMPVDTVLRMDRGLQ